MLENWADRNINQVSEGRCGVLHLGVNSPIQRYRLRTNQLRSRLAEKGLEALMDRVEHKPVMLPVANKGKQHPALH